MYTRHQEVPVYQYRRGFVSGQVYNQVWLALTRLPSPLRVSLPELKNMDIILQNDAWIVVDKAFGDVPVVAWTNFDNRHRDNLHRPIACQIRLFHAHAGRILLPCLQTLERLLRQRLCHANSC